MYKLFISRGKNLIATVAFARDFKSKLSKHITIAHKDEPRVREALEKEPVENNRIFQLFKREGIKLFNSEEVKKEEPSYQRERTSIEENNRLTMCGYCFGFFSTRYISRHNKQCQKNSCKQEISIPINILNPSNANISGV